MIKVSPSILSADFSCLDKEIKSVVKAGADWLHLDVMDGHFVPNLSFGPALVRCIRKCTDIPFDVHLMISNPTDFIKVFAEAGADYITIHLENPTVMDSIALIHASKKKVGVSISPETKISDLIPFIPMIDLILVMGVSPGFSGQNFIPKTLDRIIEIKELIGRKNVLLSVDGGVNNITADACRAAGADILVAGNYVFTASSYSKAIQTLKGI